MLCMAVADWLLQKTLIQAIVGNPSEDYLQKFPFIRKPHQHVWWIVSINETGLRHMLVQTIGPIGCY